jgi:hypothetical protein
MLFSLLSPRRSTILCTSSVGRAWCSSLLLLLVFYFLLTTTCYNCFSALSVFFQLNDKSLEAHLRVCGALRDKKSGRAWTSSFHTQWINTSGMNYQCPSVHLSPPVCFAFLSLALSGDPTSLQGRVRGSHTLATNQMHGDILLQLAILPCGPTTAVLHHRTARNNARFKMLHVDRI